MLTAADIQGLRELVKDHMAALSLITLGPDAAQVDPGDVQRLVDAGILDPAAIGALDPVADLYLLGFMSRKIEQAGIDAQSLTLDAFREQVVESPGGILPLTRTQQAAIDYARTQAGQYAVGFGDARASEVVNAAMEEEARAMIREQTGEAIEAHETAQQLTSRLGHASGDWARDWQRLAATEMQDAQNHGYAASMRQDFGGKGGRENAIRVAMVVNMDACEKCRELYLVGNTKPRIFTLDELEANGTNKGRKQREWLATLGPCHPHCHCVPVYIPEGMELDAHYHLVPASDTPEEASDE